MDKAAQGELASVTEETMNLEGASDKHMQRCKELGDELGAITHANSAMEHKLARMHAEQQQQSDAVWVCNDIALVFVSGFLDSACMYAHACLCSLRRCMMHPAGGPAGKQKEAGQAGPATPYCRNQVRRLQVRCVAALLS